jgi:hypothetical protein
MALVLNAARQAPIIAEFLVREGGTTYQGTSYAGTYQGIANNTSTKVIDLPAGAVIDDVRVYVDAAWNDTGTATIAVGDSSTANVFLAATSVKSLGVIPAATDVSLVRGKKYTSPDGIYITIDTQNNNGTAGRARVIVTYHVLGRAEFSQG